MRDRSEFGRKIVEKTTEFAARLIRLDGLCNLWRAFREVSCAHDNRGIVNRRLVLVFDAEDGVEITVGGRAGARPSRWIIGILGKEFLTRFDAGKLCNINMPFIF